MRSTGYAQSVVHNVLTDLEEQHLVERNPKERTYTAVPRLVQLDFSTYDTVREQKLRELSHIQDYAQLRDCYMQYLTTYLGDQGGYHCRTCGQCRASNFPLIRLSEGMLKAATRFLEEELGSVSLPDTFGESRGLSPSDGVWGVPTDFLFHSPPQAARRGGDRAGTPRTPQRG